MIARPGGPPPRHRVFRVFLIRCGWRSGSGAPA